MKKKYVSLTGIQYTFPVSVKKKTVWVAFNGNGNDYVTADADVQKAIEGSLRFERGEIGVVAEVKEDVEEVTATKMTEMPEVTSVQQAASILKAEPYKVTQSQVRDYATVVKVAAECGVVFPNLKKR